MEGKKDVRLLCISAVQQWQQQTGEASDTQNRRQRAPASARFEPAWRERASRGVGASPRRPATPDATPGARLRSSASSLMRSRSSAACSIRARSPSSMCSARLSSRLPDPVRSDETAAAAAPPRAPAPAAAFAFAELAELPGRERPRPRPRPPAEGGLMPLGEVFFPYGDVERFREVADADGRATDAPAPSMPSNGDVGRLPPFLEWPCTDPPGICPPDTAAIARL